MAQNQKTELLKGLYENALSQSKQRRASLPFADLEKLASTKSPLDAKAFFKREELSVIAEIKRASPSKGHLADIENPVELAKTYESAGASAISVLTEESGFKGSLDDLASVSPAVTIPTLRKDFLSTADQILEAKAFGASMVLLIMLGLDDHQYQDLFQIASELDLQVLVETHSESEIERAMAQPVQFMGINTRDLNTFETDINLFGKLSGLLPSGVIRVAESAIRNTEDAKLYRDQGADAVLVGEALVTGDAHSLIKSFRTASK